MPYILHKGRETAYLYGFPVKYTDENGRTHGISLTLADENIKGEYVTAAHSRMSAHKKQQGVKVLLL